MPQIFKIGSYIIYFWVNENDPLEPVHIHAAQGKPSPYATKIWITRAGGCLLQHNHSLIPADNCGSSCRLPQRATKRSCANGWIPLAKSNTTAKSNGLGLKSPNPILR